MKNFLCIILALMLCLSMVACGESQNTPTGENGTTEPSSATITPTPSGNITLDQVMSAPESPESDFEVVDHGNGVVELIGYLGNDEIVVIPETWNGKEITNISGYAFANDYHPNTKAVRLSDSVKVIDTGAFGLNNSLEIFVAGNSLEEIGSGAFQNCENLKEAILNDGLLSLAPAAFAGCTQLNEIVIPATVTDIAGIAFYAMGEDFTIIGQEGSAAETYANAEGYSFKTVDKE